MEAMLFIPEILDLVGDGQLKDRESKVITKKEYVNVVLMYLPAGDSLQDHRTTHPTIVHFLSGKGKMNLNGKMRSVKPDSWIYMSSEFTHSVIAEEDLKFLLYVIKQKI